MYNYWAKPTNTVSWQCLWRKHQILNSIYKTLRRRHFCSIYVLCSSGEGEACKSVTFLPIINLLSSKILQIDIFSDSNTIMFLQPYKSLLHLNFLWAHVLLIVHRFIWSTWLWWLSSLEKEWFLIFWKRVCKSMSIISFFSPQF